jgi:monoamine oxidase
MSIVTKGLQPRASRPAKVIVLGAGMAGLTAAYELVRAGHEPTILEAQNRVGGRIKTLRESFSPGLYAEAGAMRIPKVHTLTLHYVNQFGLKTAPFTMGNLDAYCFVRGRKQRWRDAMGNPDCFGFEVAEIERGKTTGQLWDSAVLDLRTALEENGPEYWDEVRSQFDNFSVREFLRERCKWSEEAIEMFGILENLEARMDSSVVALLRERLTHSFNDLVELEGGMDHLPNSFMPYLGNRIRFGAKITSIDQSPSGVTVHYQTLAGRKQIHGDYAIITLPFPVLRHIEMLQPFSYPKQRAIRQLHYDASGKVLLQCRRRFWEEDEGIHGGGTETDLSIRSLWYPDHGKETGRGILLASYTWAEDAQRWGWLSPEDRIREAIEDVSQIHPQIRDEFEVGASQMWHNDEFAGGAFALFQPEQETLLYETICRPEGRLYFAGEHASLNHRWIQGAIESGLRCADAIHTLRLPEKVAVN